MMAKTAWQTSLSGNQPNRTPPIRVFEKMLDEMKAKAEADERQKEERRQREQAAQWQREQARLQLQEDTIDDETKRMRQEKLDCETDDEW